MGRILLLAAVAGVVAVAYSSRAELARYLRIRQMDRNPALVGLSVTPQGNEAALQHSESQRERDREAGGVAPGSVR